MAQSPLQEKKFRNRFVVCWVAMLGNQTVLLYWYGLSWKFAFIDSLISTFVLMLASLLIINLLRYYLPKYEQQVNIFALCLLLASVWAIKIHWLLKWLLADTEPGYTFLLKQSMPIRFTIGFLLLGAITLISIVWYNYREQKENDTRKQDAEKLAKEAELFKLRQQLQPHFLFNSLNSINALIASRPDEARKMVQQLSDFLRGTIKKEETQWVNLGEELQYLQLYLDIEKVRFGNRLATHTIIAEEANEMKLPALLLQPIVENAIKFGLYDTTGETVISIQASKKDTDLVIEVTNPYDPETSSPQKGTGFGLQSVQRRLYLLFARNDLLTTVAKDNNFITKVKIPPVPTKNEEL